LRINVLGLPLVLLPKSFLYKVVFKNVLCRISCPNNFVFLEFMVCLIYLFSFTFASIWSFVFIAVQFVFEILLQNHISVASSLLLSCLFRVHASHSLVKMLHTNVFKYFFLVVIDRFWFTNRFILLLKGKFASAIFSSCLLYFS